MERASELLRREGTALWIDAKRTATWQHEVHHVARCAERLQQRSAASVQPWRKDEGGHTSHELQQRATSNEQPTTQSQDLIRPQSDQVTLQERSFCVMNQQNQCVWSRTLVWGGFIVGGSIVRRRSIHHGRLRFRWCFPRRNCTNESWYGTTDLLVIPAVLRTWVMVWICPSAFVACP